MKNAMKKITIILIAFSLIFVGCKKGSEKGKKEMEKEMEKIVQEAVDTAKNKKGIFDLSVVKDMKTIGSDFSVTFQTREYPKDVKDFEAMRKNAKIGTGKANYRILKWETLDKVGIWEAKKGNKILVVHLEVYTRRR